ncbi:MAG: MarR family winged helix-turn-helix transcriptional regulator [Rhodospirillales bacterium]|jgi:DNA-binding MarR family transcriptional regulator
MIQGILFYKISLIIKLIEKIMNTETPKQKDYANLWNRPGYLIRRLHQIHVAMFLNECKEYNVTPVQFGVLTVLNQKDTSDLTTIARQIGVDRITVADVVRRLEGRGLISRPANTKDKRTKLARITAQGKTFVESVQPAMIQAQRRFIEPLEDDEERVLNKLLTKLILANNNVSRAPMTQENESPQEQA